MRSWILPLASFLLAAALVTGCSDDETSPAPGIFSVSLSGLPVLPESLYYEAFARFPTALAHGDLDPVSLGAFKVDKDGNLLSLTGGPANFGLVDASNLNPEDIVITVRTPDDTLGVLLGGRVGGDDNEGRATLTTAYHDAVFAGDHKTPAGTCILATPSTSAIDDSTQGVWFVNNSNDRVPSLSLPDSLGEHWLYGAWVFNGGDTVAVGQFAKADSADSDGAGPGAGLDQGFNAPGSDFIAPPRDLADGESTVFVTIQPEGHADPGPGLEEPELFPLRILELAIPSGVASDSSMTLSRPAAPLPTGEITFTR